MQYLKTVRFDKQTRILITAVLLVLALIVTAGGALFFKIDPAEARQLADKLEREAKQSNDVRLIFGNNLIITIIMFVPIIGPIWGLFVLFNTGTLFAVVSIAKGIHPILVFLFLLFTPVFWLEWAAYSISMGQSVVLLLQIIRHQVKREIVRTCILITACTLILLGSAIIEWAMIKHIETDLVTPQL